MDSKKCNELLSKVSKIYTVENEFTQCVYIEENTVGGLDKSSDAFLYRKDVFWGVENNKTGRRMRLGAFDVEGNPYKFHC